MPKNQPGTRTLLYSVKAIDGRAADMPKELRSLEVMKSMAAKSPTRYKAIAPLVTHLFQIRFTEIVPLAKPIYFGGGAKKKSKIDWRQVIKSTVLPTVTPTDGANSRYTSAVESALRNLKIDVRELDEVVLPEGAVRENPRSQFGEGGGGATKAAIMEALFGTEMVGDGRGHYGETVPETEEDKREYGASPFTVTVDRSGGQNKATYSYKDGRGVYCHEYYDKGSGNYQGRTEEDGTRIGSGGALEPRVQRYMRQHAGEPPPDAETGVTAAQIETIMTLALFRSEAQQILKGLGIKGGGAVDVPNRRKVTPWQLFKFDAAFNGMIRKAFERHMEAKRNKYGLLEKKRKLGGTVVFKWVGWTDPPNMSVNVR